MASDYRCAPDECAVPPLEIGMQTIQSSPYRSGVAGPQRTHLPLFPALPTCSCPLALSGRGQLFASESLTLNSGHLRWQFRPCVTRRTLSPHTAQHLQINLCLSSLSSRAGFRPMDKVSFAFRQHPQEFTCSLATFAPEVSES